MSQSWDYIAKLVCIGDSGTGKSSLSVRLCEGRFVNWHDVTIGVEYSSTVVPVGPPASLKLDIPNPHKKSPPPSTAKTKPNPSSPTSKSGSTFAAAAAKHLPAADPSTSEAAQKRMKLSLWDTAGQETYKSITRSYFRGASGALLVFDITRRSTFESVTDWLHDLRQIAEEGIVVVLVGNKLDLAGASIVEDGGGGSSSNNTGAHSGTLAGQDGRVSSPTRTATPPVSNVNAKKNRREVTYAEAEAWCKANNVLKYVETSAKSGDGVERAFLEVAERIFQNIEAGKYDLNDRRSGVKGPGAGGGGSGGRRQGEVVLGVNDVGGMRAGKSGWGSCC